MEVAWCLYLKIVILRVVWLKSMQMNGEVSCMVDKNTVLFNVDMDKSNEARVILESVYEALNEKGYNPISQLVGYLLSGDPTYVTNHKNSRANITKIDRDELLEEVLKFYLENKS